LWIGIKIIEDLIEMFIFNLWSKRLMEKLIRSNHRIQESGG